NEMHSMKCWRSLTGMATVQEDDQGRMTRTVVCRPGHAQTSALAEVSGCQPASRAEACLPPEKEGRGEARMVRRTSLALATSIATLALLAGVARPTHAQALDPPTNVDVYPKDKAVFLTWEHAADNSLVGYNVYRRNSDQTADKAALVN